MEDVIEQADYLYGSGETEKLYQLLVQHKNRYFIALEYYSGFFSVSVYQLIFSLWNAGERIFCPYVSRKEGLVIFFIIV